MNPTTADGRRARSSEPTRGADVGFHYLLHGYVCGGGCFKPSPFDGWATFTQLFQRRPDGCRYAIAQPVPIRVNPDKSPNTPLVLHNEPLETWWCWDMHDETLVRGSPLHARGLLSPPPALWSAPNPDALVMKAFALYDRS